MEVLIAWSMLPGSVTSRRLTSTLSRPARSRAAETSRIVATTFQPLSAKSLAVAWPNPVDEPVISTVFLFMIAPHEPKDVVATTIVRHHDQCVQDIYSINLITMRHRMELR